MRLDLENLEAQGGKFSHAYQPGELSFDEADLVVTQPARVAGRVYRRDGAVELKGEVHARLVVPCGRCLKQVELPVDVDFAERFVSAVDWRDEDQHELRAEDLDLAVFDGYGIVLDDLVREEILLSVPAQVLCCEQCKGLCPVCGIDRNESTCDCEAGVVDSRWEKLRELRS